MDEKFLGGNWPKLPAKGPAVKAPKIKDIFPTTLKELREQVDSAALELVDARASADSRMRHLYVVCRIKDADKLNASSALAGRKFVVSRRAGRGWSLQQEMNITGQSILGATHEETDKALKDLERAYGRENIRKILGKYSLTLSVTAPDGFEATSRDGKIHRKKTVIWKKSLVDLLYSQESWKMGVSFAKAQ